jgi:hypothetical protein
MTRDDIIRMARRAADYWANHYDRKSKADMELLRKHVAEKFIEIAAAEREVCAKVCEGINSAEDYYGDRVELVCAEAIRERGQK